VFPNQGSVDDDDDDDDDHHHHHRGFHYKSWRKYSNILKYREISKSALKCLGNIWPVISSTGIMSLLYRPPLYFLAC
jgi:hypothetical protein